MTVEVTGEAEGLIARLLASGRYHDANEVVCAGVRELARETSARGTLESFPPGSLRMSLTDERNNEELALLKGSSLAVENE